MPTNEPMSAEEFEPTQPLDEFEAETRRQRSTNPFYHDALCLVSAYRTALARIDQLTADNAGLVKALKMDRDNALCPKATDWDGVAERISTVLTPLHPGTALLEELARLRTRVKELTKFYDDHHGTPCEQIRHHEELEQVKTERDALKQRVAWLERQPVPLNRAQRNSNIYQAWLAQEPKENL